MSGIQNWSRSKIYPFTIVVVENHDNGQGVVYGQHPSGERTQAYWYYIGNDRQFQQAHNFAVSDCARIIGCARTIGISLSRNRLRQLEFLTSGVFMAGEIGAGRRAIHWDAETLARCGS